MEGMNPKDSLPVILVSASDRATAESFISELIDNEVKEAESGYEEGEAVDGRIWRLVNKYYRADVLVRARGDDDADAGLSADAHVIYFTPQEVVLSTLCYVLRRSLGKYALEYPIPGHNIICLFVDKYMIEIKCSAGSAACAEVRAAVKEVEGAEVLVAALRARQAVDALTVWAASAHYEAVLLLEDEEQEPAGPFGAERGVERVRAALHAHPWRGLLRLDRPHRPHRPALMQSIGYDSLSSGGSSAAEDEDEEEAEAAAVERAEEFVRALGALGDLGDAGPGGAGGAGGDRRARAEQLVAAFCRALGHDLDAC